MRQSEVLPTATPALSERMNSIRAQSRFLEETFCTTPSTCRRPNWFLPHFISRTSSPYCSSAYGGARPGINKTVSMPQLKQLTVSPTRQNSNRIGELQKLQYQLAFDIRVIIIPSPRDRL